MIFVYAMLLLACFGFWSSREAVVCVRRRQLAMVPLFGGIALLCLLLPNTEWFFLMPLVDVALFVIADRTDGPKPWRESTWKLCVLAITPLVLLDLVTGWQVVPMPSIAQWLKDLLPLIVLAGGLSAYLTQNDSLPPATESSWPWWREKIKHAIDDIIDYWRGRTLRQVCSELMGALGAILSARLTQLASKFRRKLRQELTDLIEFIKGTPPTLNGLRSWHASLKCQWMRISVSGPVLLPSWQTHFPHETTKYISLAGEVVVWKRSHIGDLCCPVVYRYYKPNGSLLAEQREDVLIKHDWERFSFAWRWGWPEPGHWEPGIYGVKVFMAGELLQTAGFTIDPPPPPPSWTLADILSQATVLFYASQTASDARQDSVRFPQATTRQIICVLTVRNHYYQHHDETWHMTAQCYTPEEKILWEDHRDWLIKAGEEEASISWAWQESRPWKAGAYRQEIQINGEDFAWGAFLIEEPPTTVEEPPSTHESAENIPEKKPSDSADVVQQTESGEVGLGPLPPQDTAESTRQQTSQVGNIIDFGAVLRKRKEKEIAALTDRLIPIARQVMLWYEEGYGDAILDAGRIAVGLRDKEAAERIIARLSAQHGYELIVGHLAVLLGDEVGAESVVERLATKEISHIATYQYLRAGEIAAKLPDKKWTMGLIKRFEGGGNKISAIYLAVKIGDQKTVERLFEELMNDQSELFSLEAFKEVNYELALFNHSFGKGLINLYENGFYRGNREKYHGNPQRAVEIAVLLGDTKIARKAIQHYKGGEHTKDDYFHAGWIAAITGDDIAAEEMLFKAFDIVRHIWIEQYNVYFAKIIGELAKHNSQSSEKIWRKLERQLNVYYVGTMAGRILEHLNLPSSIYLEGQS